MGRVQASPNELIDRSRTIKFYFAGRQYTAHPGDTIASALTAHGVKILSRSFKYHRPRGLMGYGHSPASMVQIGNEVSVNAWTRLVEDGMVVDAINAWPSLENDWMSMSQLGSRFLPVGFYYKTFIRPQSLWPQYENMLRNIAGLGKVDIDAPLVKGYDKEYVHGDVAVIGGGPAGMQAALSAAESGVRVILFDENPALGGHLLFSDLYQEELDQLTSAVNQHENITIYTDTIVMGWFEDNWLYGTRGKRMYKIRAKATIFATGAYDQPPLFDNNDLPGIMLGSAAQRLLHLYGACVGKRIMIVTANEDGWQLSRELQAAGIEIAAIADHRESASPSSELSGEVPVYLGQTIVKAEGKKHVTAAVLAPIRSESGNNSGTRQQIGCDAIFLCTSWAPANSLLYQAGATIVYDEARREFLPQTLPAGIFAAGRVAGTHSVETEIAEGNLAGRSAAAYARGGTLPDAAEFDKIAAYKAKEPVRTSEHYHSVGEKYGKRFVDLDEDVSDKDIYTAIAEGYNSVELLKRYSTISMGPSQGRWSSINTIHLTAEQNNWSIAETGTTTSRPPAQPIQFASLAGQMMEPIRYSAVHSWHEAQGATMMNAGLWERAEHYGDPHAEIKAVRQTAGLIDVSTLGKIKLTGPGVPGLLNKLYINKWMKLGIGRVRYGIMCTSEGVVMDDGVTARISENEWYMSTTSSGAGAVFEWIQWWLQSGWGEGIHAASLTEGMSAFNLAGPNSRLILAKLTDEDISNEAFPYMHLREMRVAGVPSRVMRIGFTGELSYEIHCPSSYALHVWEALMEAGRPEGMKAFGVEAQRVLRLEKAHIIVGQDTDATSDPISAGQEWAVKLDKPDFLGQRSITRIANNGVTEMLTGFKMVDKGVTPEEGLQIVTDTPVSEACPLGIKIIGWVTSSRFSPTLNESIGLCWLPIEMAQQEGTEFTIRREGKLIRAKVHHGAFVDPDGGRLKS